MVLHGFELPPSNPFGGLVRGTDGNFYGTTEGGGTGGYGTVFQMTPSEALTTLHSFTGADGAHPRAGLIQGTDGNFYGTTYTSSTGVGTVFKITPAGTLTTLHFFTGVDGAYPHAGLIQGTDGNFYGTTYGGGASNYGTVFQMTPFGTLTTLHSFTGAEGEYPYFASLVQGTDGDFYGTTWMGGASGAGTVFKITPAGTLTTLHSFTRTSGTEWATSFASPWASLIQGTDGNLYGTTYYDGASNYGTVFKITPAGTLTTLHSFTGGTEGANPWAGLIQGTDGNFYGTTEGGGTGTVGTVFRMTPSGALTTLHSFTGADGSHPRAGLIQGTDGNFYGTTYTSSTGGGGTVFKITPAGALTTLHSFTETDGASPRAGLIQGTDGNFYGTTSAGSSAMGTVYKITPGGVLTMLHAFSISGGLDPWAGLIQGSDGNFYGTTAYGGTGPYGTVFQMTPSGTLTTLYPFTGGTEGANPYAGLTQGTDGNFYGTTFGGGASSAGAVFKITPAGTLTTLHSFTGFDGGYPSAGLIQGTNGNFYGTTYLGGHGGGTVFQMTPSGALTTLHFFTGGTEGSKPWAGLIQGTDGNFYGTTTGGGTGTVGTVFNITPSGTLTTLHSLTGGTDGANPKGGLIQGTDGNFYGTTSEGGASNYGTVFQMAPSGTLTTLHSFTGGTDGTNPWAGLIQGTDGSFYGTTFQGGPSGAGVVFRLTVCTINPPKAVASGTATVCAGQSTILSGSGGVTCSWSPATGLTDANSCTPSAAPLGTTTYMLTVVSASGCISANAASATVTVSTASATPGIVTAQASAKVGTAGLIASIPMRSGSTFNWAITNGTITAGQGTNQVTFTAGLSVGLLTLSVVETIAAGCQLSPATANVAITGMLFYTLPPCRVLDTRNATGPLGGPALQPGATRRFDPVGSPCGIPADAVAISANLTVTNVVALGELVVFPADVLRPNTSALSFRTGRTRANNAIVSFSKSSTTFSVFNNSAATVGFIVDVNGFFR